MLMTACAILAVDFHAFPRWLLLLVNYYAFAPKKLAGTARIVSTPAGAQAMSSNTGLVRFLSSIFFGADTHRMYMDDAKTGGLQRPRLMAFLLWI